MKIVFTAGGGGHFAPLLAFLPQLRSSDSYQIIGRKYAFEGDTAIALEYKTAKERNLSYTTITTGRLQRTFTRHTLPSLAKVPIGVFQSVVMLSRLKPDIVVSFGGYVTVPVVLAAKILGIPILVHEQTPRAGLANKISSRFASVVCISWQSSMKFFPKGKAVLTGNPMQKVDTNKPLPKELQITGSEPLLVIVGGSLGSHALNVIIEKNLPALVTTYRIIHQTGDAKTYQDYDRLVALKLSLSEHLRHRYTPVKFLDPSVFPTVLSHAELVISRVGINTALYLLKLKKPALLIPLSHGQKNEQLENAQLLKQFGIAETLQESDITPKLFMDTIASMLSRIHTYTFSDDTAQKIVSDDASEKLYEVIQKVAQT